MIDKDVLWKGQFYNKIPGAIHLNNKDEVPQISLKYASKFTCDKSKCYIHEKLFPETYIMQDPSDCKKIIKILTEQQQKSLKNIQWIGKIARGVHQGKGVEIFTAEKISQFLSEYDHGAKCDSGPDKPYIVQKYIENPFLLNGRKFEFRVYFYIVSLDPYLVLFHM